jgi:hypothetical protein
MPYDRLDEEPVVWFSRFEGFRSLGPSRSLLAAYNAEREKEGKRGTATSVPQPWDEAARRWDWRRRAEAFDLHQVEEDRRASRDELQGIRRESLLIAQGMRKKALEAMKGLPAAALLAREIRAWLTDSLRMELQARGLPLALLARPEARDLEDSLAFYRAVIANPTASVAERLRARERLDKLLGLESLPEDEPADDAWQDVLERVRNRAGAGAERPAGPAAEELQTCLPSEPGSADARS